jgi:hypothetical protein
LLLLIPRAHSKIEKNKIYSLFHVLGRLFYIFFAFTVCNSKIEKNKINVQIKKIEHGIANIFYFFRFYYVHAVLTTKI